MTVRSEVDGPVCEDCGAEEARARVDGALIGKACMQNAASARLRLLREASAIRAGRIARTTPTATIGGLTFRAVR